MTQIRAKVENRHITIPAPVDLPDGTEVVLSFSAGVEKIGLDESEWRDSPEAISDWIAWLGTIEPIEFANDGAFEAQFRRYNLEAVRKQMAEEGE